MTPAAILGAVSVVVSMVVGCSGKQGSASSPSAAASSADATSSVSDGGLADGGGATSAPVAAARPFASTPLEAQSLIQEQIDSRLTPLLKCVGDYRTRKGDPHKSVAVDVGIDQEGTLLGVVTPTPKKGDLDPTLRACLMAALHGLAFPRSHAGIITVRQTFKDAVIGP